jgi:hypothetical protein
MRKYRLGDLCIHERVKLKYEEVYVRMWAASFSFGARSMVGIWCDLGNDLRVSHWPGPFCSAAFANAER